MRDQKIAIAADVVSGKIKSCGCLRLERLKESNKLKKTKHGMSSSRIYKIWAGIKKRTKSDKNKTYKNVKMCEEWFNCFCTFYDWAMRNGYDEYLTIDRIDVNGDYTPTNCRWVTQAVQNRNKTNSILLSIGGVERNLAEWCALYKVKYGTALARKNRGYIGDNIIFGKFRNNDL